MWRRSKNSERTVQKNYKSELKNEYLIDISRTGWYIKTLKRIEKTSKTL